MVLKYIKCVGELINKFLVAVLLSAFFYVVLLPYKIFRKPYSLTWTKYSKEYKPQELIHPW